MSNWIVTLTKNNLHLTREAIKSFRDQDIEGGVRILVVDNHSTDNTCEWLKTQSDIFTIFNRPANSVAGAWNQALRWLFGYGWVDGNTPRPPRCEYALVCNNDVILRPDTYRWLVADGGGFVTAVGTRDPEKIKPDPVTIFDERILNSYLHGGPSKDKYSIPDPKSKRPHPDFSCYMIRREIYERVGEFDENFKVAFLEDGDYDLRMWRAGIRGYCLDLPFLHYGSMTVKNADPVERGRIIKAADRNREYFLEKYGFQMGSEEYYKALDKWAPPEEA